MSTQLALFDVPPAHETAAPDGFRYQPELLVPDEEQALVARVRALPLREFDFHGYVGRRRVVSFGWRYDFGGRQLRRADAIPDFLLALREIVAPFAALEADALEQVLVSEYAPGAGIGWHRDKPVFGEVVGVSLLAPCVFRFRRSVGQRWRRAQVVAEPRSAYLLSGPARGAWEHSIPPVKALRYSITFRTLRSTSH